MDWWIIKERFYVDLGQGIAPLKTTYFKNILRRKEKRSLKENLIKHMYEKVNLYESIKKDGIKFPPIVNENNVILDGNHRKEIWEYFGHKDIIIRKI